jgi:uncharacterized cupin superfamily protein
MTNQNAMFKKLVMLFFLLLISCFIYAQNTVVDSTIIHPISFDKKVLSGLDLKAVQSSTQPDRKLFQKRLFKGEEIGVYLVASETASATWTNYTIDEFIYVLNGRARLKPQNGVDNFFHKGDFFFAPKGYKGDWETQGGASYYYELSVVGMNRSKTEAKNSIIPIHFDKAKLSGLMTAKEKEFSECLYKGVQLTVILESELPIKRRLIHTAKDVFIQVLSGSVKLTSKDGSHHTYYNNEAFVLPKGFSGTWESYGFEVFRSLQVEKTQY